MQFRTVGSLPDLPVSFAAGARHDTGEVSKRCISQRRKSIQERSSTHRAQAFKLITVRRDRSDPAPGPVTSMEVTPRDANQSQAKSLLLNPPTQASRKARPVDFDNTQSLAPRACKASIPAV